MNTRSRCSIGVACAALALTAVAGQAAAAASHPQSAPAEDITLTFWNYWDGHNGEVMQELADRYADEHPGVTINNQFFGFGDLLPKLQAAVSGGDAPDIAAVDMIWMPQLAASGRIAALDDQATRAGIDLGDFYPALLNVDTYDGTLYGVPLSTNNLELIINRDLFNAAGLDPDQPPTTWDELRADAKQCTDAGSGTYGMELFTDPGEGLTWQFQVYLWQAGGAFLNEDNTAAAFNSEAGTEALQFWLDLLLTDGSASVAPWGAFSQGAACMVMDGSWVVGGMAADPPFDFGTAAMPIPTDGQPATNMGGEHAVVFANEDQATVDAAADFLAWMSSPEIQEYWDVETGFMPIRTAVAESPTYADAVEPRLLPFIENQQYAHNRPPVTQYSELSDAFSGEIETALLGDTTAAEALASAETAVNDILASN